MIASPPLPQRLSPPFLPPSQPDPCQSPSRAARAVGSGGTSSLSSTPPSGGRPPSARCCPPRTWRPPSPSSASPGRPRCPPAPRDARETVFAHPERPRVPRLTVPAPSFLSPQALLAALHYSDDGAWHRLRPRGRSSGFAPSLLPFTPDEGAIAVDDLQRTGLADILDLTDGPPAPPHTRKYPHTTVSEPAHENIS